MAFRVLNVQVKVDFYMVCRRSQLQHPFLRNFGNPLSRVNLVMTSAHERASEQTSVRTDSGGGEGTLNVARAGSSRMPSFLGGITNTHCLYCCARDHECQQTIAELIIIIMFSREGLTEAESEREQLGA